MGTNHWDEVYSKKMDAETSWFQEKPLESLKLIEELKLDLKSKIIDIGGGNSRLIEHLIKMGFQDLSILDISHQIIEKSKLGLKESNVKFIVSDVLDFHPTEKYDLWHDRATFHFLTKIEDVERYLSVANSSLKPGGCVIISTFAKTGPNKCSGLSVQQYSEGDLKKCFGQHFKNVKCFEHTHHTPWGVKQDFTYCLFKKLAK